MKKAKPLIYICAPFRTATPEEYKEVFNIGWAALMKGWIPVWAPFMFGGWLNDNIPAHSDLALDCAISVMLRCNAVCVLRGRVTEGMEKELDYLENNSIIMDVYYWPDLPSALDSASESV